MTVDEQTRQALDLSRLSLPASPPVTAIEPEEYVDSSGEEALRVWVVLPEDVDLSKIAGDDVLTLKSVIRRSLREQHIERYPYIYLVKASERHQPPEEGA